MGYHTELGQTSTRCHWHLVPAYQLPGVIKIIIIIIIIAII